MRTELPFLDDFGQTAAIQQAYALDTANRRTVTTTDVKGRSKTTYANALSQIVEIQDANSNSLTYSFDSQGNLTRTVDSAGNTINVGYDLLGRRTSLNDPDMGLSSFTYNIFSEMTSQTDAKGQTITMIYDKLGRMTTRSVPGPASESGGSSVFTYDTAANGIGAIASVSGPNGYLKTYSYDQTTRPSGDFTTIKGGSYTQSYGYNANGQLATRSYPDSGAGQTFSVNYNYLNGYLSSITGGDPNSANCIEHWRADKYDALGRAEEETLGKLVTTTRSYKPGQGVLEHIQSIVNQGGTVQNLSYTYDAGNNLATRSDAVNASTESFIYDNLDRLTQHTKGGDLVDVTYDAIGNILSKSDVGSYNYDGINAGPHALTSVNSPTPTANPLAKFAVNWEWNGETIPQSQPQIHDSQFQYDANGNIKVSGDRYVWWTAFDKPYRMERYNGANGSVTTGSNLEYDAEFNRIYKLQDDGEATVYIGTDYERITEADGHIIHRYTISTGGAAIQIERADGTGFDQPKYLLADNLGSTNVILDASGNVEQTLAFDPWGMRLNVGDVSAVNSITNKGYTGHEMDDEVGLVNMNARIYDPYLGRFLSADPVLPDAYDMQSFNRYSYVSNNPLRYTDPTGNRECEDNGCDPDELDEPNAIWVFVDYVEAIIDSYDAPEAPADVSEDIQHIGDAAIDDRGTSDNGIEFIKSWETFKSSPYKVEDENGNPSGNWTVGYGHEITDEEHASGDFDNISEEKAAELLSADLEEAERSVDRFIENNNPDIELSQNQYDALVSATFNSGYLGQRPKLSANFAAGNHGGVAYELLDITNGGVKGLVRRRRSESNLYLYGDYSGNQ